MDNIKNFEMEFLKMIFFVNEYEEDTFINVLQRSNPNVYQNADYCLMYSELIAPMFIDGQFYPHEFWDYLMCPLEELKKFFNVVAEREYGEYCSLSHFLLLEERMDQLWQQFTEEEQFEIMTHNCDFDKKWQYMLNNFEKYYSMEKKKLITELKFPCPCSN